MPINVNFDTPPIPPSSADKTNFRLRYDAFLAYIQSLGTKLIDFVTQINDLVANINAKEVSATAAAQSAASSANYKGVFIQGTSSAVLGESWTYSGVIYKCNAPTSNNPTLDPTKWTSLGIDSQINSTSEKTAPINADKLGIWDSVSNSLKSVSFATLRTVLFNSPTFSNTPTAPTAPDGTNTTQIATTAFVTSANKILQVVYAELTTSGTGTGTFPHDGTIPQNTEGNEILSLAITPKNASSKLLILVTTMFGEVSNTGNFGAAALFKDTNTDAIAVGELPAGNDSASLTHGTVCFQHIESSINTNLRTYKLRVGIDGGACRWNGYGANQYYGVSNKTTITIMEIA